MGWIGIKRQVMYALRIAKADRDEDGRFLIYGDTPCFFLGMDGDDAEVVVSDRVEYSVNGERASLAGLLSSTSYGSKVHVI